MRMPSFPQPVTSRRRMSLSLAAGAILAVVASVLVPFTPLAPVVPTPVAEAASPAAFNPGNLITDATFYNPDEMTVAEIQTFLNGAVPTCAAGYTCLKSYSETTYTRPADVYCTNAYTGVAGQSSASIIKAVALACGINPRVLLVLMQKEQSLVTATAPTAAKFQRATGYACPDSGTCAPSTLGFYNQVYKAAWQFKVYRYNPPRWRHQPGQVNQIYLHPNTAACGTKAVFIENQATAGLYNYTPYTPNDAALNNMYGTGDACSSYGNRNFWRIYTDWFGNPNGASSLLQSSTDNKVYLLNNNEKYLVPTAALATTLAVLGPVQKASQSYLDVVPTAAPAASNLAISGAGVYYLIGNGTKHLVPSCAIAVQYGFPAPCDSPVFLTDVQLSKFTTGAPLGQFTRSYDTGITYTVANGVKRAFQSVDQMAAVAGGQPTVAAVAPQYILDLIPSGPDYYYPGSAVQVAGSTQRYMATTDGTLIPVASAEVTTAFGMRTTRTLSAAAFAASTVLPGSLGIAVTCTGVPFIAGGGKLYPVPADSGLPVTALDQATCDAFAKGATAPGAATFFISTGNQWIWYINAGTKRFMNGLAPIVAVNGSSPRVHIPATPALLDSIPTQSVWPGALVKDSAGSLYLIDGTTRKIPTTAATAAAYGLTSPGTITDVQAAAYPTATASLTIAVTCTGVPFIAGGGALYPVPADSGLPVTVLDPSTCAAIPKGASAPGAATFFISTGNQWIWYINGGTKRFMNGLAPILAVNGTSPRVHIPATPDVLNSIPTQSVWPGALVKDSAGALFLIDGTSQKIPTTAATAAAYGLTSPGTITDTQAAAYPTAAAALTIAVTCTGTPFIAGGGSLYPVPANSGLAVTVLDQTTCNAFPKGAAAPGAATFFISTGNQWIWYISGGTKRFMNGLPPIVAVNGTSPRVHIPATPEMLNSIPTQSVWPGALVKDSAGALFLIDGTSQKIPTTAATAAAYGLTSPGTITDLQAASYPTAAASLTIAVTCGGVPFIAGGGKLYPVPADSGLAVTVLDPTTCDAFAKGAPAPGAATFFISTGNQWIWYISGGTKRFMNGLPPIVAVNGTSPRVHIPATPEMLNSIPTAP